MARVHFKSPPLLSPQEHEVLGVLLDNENEAVTWAQFENKVFGLNAQAVRIFAHRIKKELMRMAPEYQLVSCYGKGYKLIKSKGGGNMYTPYRG